MEHAQRQFKNVVSRIYWDKDNKSLKFIKRSIGSDLDSIHVRNSTQFINIYAFYIS